jgi:DNA polymerase-3 subunit delta
MPKAAAKPKTIASKIYAVVGSDESEVKRVAAEHAAELTPAEAGEFGSEIIDGCADNADQAATRIRSTIEALQTLPFFGGGKLVWLKNVNFMSDSVTGRAASVLEALEELSDVINAGLGDSVTLLISALDVDKRRSFYKTLGKRGEIEVFDRLDSSRSGWEEEATEIVRKRAGIHKLRFDEDALELFVLLTGGDTRQIENELEKTDIFLGQEKRVTVDHVRELVPLSRAGVIFELGNALAVRDLERALKLVRRLLDQGEKAIGILLAAVLPTIRNLLLASDLIDRYRLPRPQVPFQFISAINRLPEEATEHLPRKKDGGISGYALGIAAQNAHRFGKQQLMDGMDACLKANLRLVTSQLDHELILTQIVVRVIGEAEKN